MANTSKRIGYIDALRGLTMILVVFGHLYMPQETPANTYLLYHVRMPMFFFISGFISFRREQSWSGRETISRLGEKVRTMVIPTLAIGLLYVSIRDGIHVSELFTHHAKMGYWFTISLFNMLVFYYTARYIHQRRNTITMEQFTKRLFWISIIMWLLLIDLKALGDINHILTIQKTAKYLPFFAFGALCSCHRESFHRLVDDKKKSIMAIILLVMLSLSLIVLNKHRNLIASHTDMQVVWTSGLVIKTLMGYLGIYVIFGIFRRFGKFFSENKYVGKPLQYVGRRTLDIYLLHYFVLAAIPATIKPFIADTSNLPLSIVIGIASAIVIVAISLAISRTLRLSDHVAYYLLGERKMPGKR